MIVVKVPKIHPKSMKNRKHTYLKSSVFRTSILYRFLLFFGCKIAIKKQSLRSKKTESKQSSFSNAFCGWLQTLTRGPESTQEIPKARHERISWDFGCHFWKLCGIFVGIFFGSCASPLSLQMFVAKSGLTLF